MGTGGTVTVRASSSWSSSFAGLRVIFRLRMRVCHSCRCRCVKKVSPSEVTFKLLLQVTDHFAGLQHIRGDLSIHKSCFVAIARDVFTSADQPSTVEGF